MLLKSRLPLEYPQECSDLGDVEFRCSMDCNSPGEKQDAYRTDLRTVPMARRDCRLKSKESEGTLA